MDIRRVEGSFDQYKIVVTSTELETLRRGLGATPGAEADAMLGALDWYLDRLPAPGETKEEAKQREDLEDGGDETPLAGDDGVGTEVDELIAGVGEEDVPGGEALPGGTGPGNEDFSEVETEVDELVPEAPGGERE